MLTTDIQWQNKLSEALTMAAQLNRAIVLKPLGQGSGPNDDW